MWLLAVGLMLTGCWDRRDPEKMAWVTAIGIDKGPRGDYIFSFQVAAPSGRGGGGTTGGGGGGMGGAPGRGSVQHTATSDVFAIEAPDIVTAVDGSQSFVARRLSLTQAKAVIIGEEVARDDVTPVIAAATRYYEFRRNMSVMVARGNAYAFLKQAQPRLEPNPARWYELLMVTQAQAGIIPETRINEFVMESEAPGTGARATLVAVRPDIAAGVDPLEKEIAGREDGGPPPPIGRARAGEVDRARQIPVEFMGAALFKGSRLAGFLSGDEARFVSMLRGEFRHASMAFVDPNRTDRRLVLRLQQRLRPVMRTQLRSGQVHVQFNVDLEGELVSVQSTTNYTEPAQLDKLEASVSAELRRRMSDVIRKTLGEWGIDPFRIAGKLRTSFPTVQEWEAFDWGNRVAKTTFSVSVSVTVRRFGLLTDVIRPRE